MYILIQYTVSPLKINIQPQNHPIEKGTSEPHLHFFGGFQPFNFQGSVKAPSFPIGFTKAVLDSKGTNLVLQPTLHWSTRAPSPCHFHPSRLKKGWLPRFTHGIWRCVTGKNMIWGFYFEFWMEGFHMSKVISCETVSSLLVSFLFLWSKIGTDTHVWAKAWYKDAKDVFFNTIAGPSCEVLVMVVANGGLI